MQNVPVCTKMCKTKTEAKQAKRSNRHTSPADHWLSSLHLSPKKALDLPLVLHSDVHTANLHCCLLLLLSLLHSSLLLRLRSILSLLLLLLEMSLTLLIWAGVRHW